MQQMQEEKGNQGQCNNRYQHFHFIQEVGRVDLFSISDESENLKTYDLRAPLNKKFWKHQKPIEVPNLPALNPHKVKCQHHRSSCIPH